MIHEFTISNGLKVIGVESHKSPVVSVQMWVRNGSADERSGDEGLSHFIEHLVFKGSKDYKVGEIAATVEACGGEINAYTSFDQTVYYVTISSQFFDKALHVISQMVGHPIFDEQEVDREREVVIEEIKRGNDSLGRRASRQLFSSLYPNYPYSVPVIGYDEIIKNIPRKRIVEFFSERYVARNMFLVVTGDFSAQDFEARVKKYFQNIIDAPAKLPPRPSLQMNNSKKVVVEKTTFEEAVLYVAWPAIDIRHKDLAAMECLALILGQGASSRLLTALRLKKHLVNSIGSGIWAPATQGFFSISASLNPEKIAETLEEIKKELEHFFAGGILEEELQKAKVNFMADDAYGIETVGGLARKYGGNYEATGDIHFHETFHTQLQAVTVEDVMRIAREYLDPQKMLLSCLTPQAEEPVRKLLEGWTFHQSVATNKAVAAPVTKMKRFESKAQGSSPKTILRDKTQEGWRSFDMLNTGAPVFHLRIASLGGSRVVDPDKAGLTELVGRTWTAQTQVRNELQMKAKIDAMASSVYAFSGRNTVGLVVEGLSDFQKELSELFLEIIEKPSISSEIMEREKEMLLESLRSRKDSPSYIASLNFQKMMFEGHPYSVDSTGNEQTLKNISVQDLQNYIQTHFVASQTVSSLCGDYNPELWKKILQKASSQISQTKPSFKEPQAQEIGSSKYRYEHAEKEQTHIIYGFRGVSLLDSQRFTLQVIEAILAGQGGRLFLELRDKASLAYSVSPMRMEGIGTGYFATYIGCSPEKAETAIAMMNEELMKLVDHRVGEEEVSRAKNYLIGGHDIGLQKNSSIAAAMAFNEVYGLPAEELFDYAQNISSVTAEQIQAMAKKLFTQPSVLSVVGPREPKLVSQS